MRYLVFGLGKTGLSCIKYLLGLGHTVLVVDTKQNPSCKLVFLEQYAAQVAYYFGDISKDILDDIDALVISPGIPPEHYLVAAAIDKNISIMTDLDLFNQATAGKYILVTGTNGKSTVVSLLAKILQSAGYQVAVGGNIGTPILDCLNLTVDWFVIEISSFQLFYSNYLQAEFGVITNIDVDHLDWHTSLDRYIAAKLKIVEFSKQLIIDVNISKLLTKNCPKFTFGDTDAADIVLANNGDVLYQNEVLIKACDYNYRLAGMQMNVAMVVAISLQLNLSIEVVRSAIGSFLGLPHRCQHFLTTGKLKWINDSKATNMHAVKQAVSIYRDKSIVLILTGVLKEVPSETDIIVLAKKVKLLLLVGDIAEYLLPLCQRNNLQYKYFATLEKVVIWLKNVVNTADLILFSPGGASFDRFDNFQHRGDSFMQLVKEAYA